MSIRHYLLLFFVFTTVQLSSSAQTLFACNETDPITKTKRWGFCDRFYSGAVIKCQFDSTMSFTEGLGRVRVNGKYGFVDKTGKLVIPAKYDGAMEFKDGFAPVFLNGKAFFIDKKGVDLFKKSFKAVAHFSNGLAMCTDSTGKRGFIDVKGNTVIPFTLYGSYPFYGDITSVSYDDQSPWKAVNKKGEVVFTFNDKVKSVLGSFSEGLVQVYVDGPAGYNSHFDFVNTKGEFISDVPYISAQPFKNGRAIVARENKNRKSGDLQFFKYGLINKEGREIVLAQYACLEESPIPGIYFYGKTAASISNCNGYGLMDSMGKELTPPVYSSFTKLNDTTFLCKEAGRYESLNKYLLLTTQGKNLLSLNHSKKYFEMAGTDTLLVLYSETTSSTAISIYNIHSGLLKENTFKGYTLFKKQRLLLIEDWEYTSGVLMTTDGKIILDKIQTHSFRGDSSMKGQIPFILVSTDRNEDFKMFNINTRKIMVNDYGFKNERNPYYSAQFTEGLLPIRQKGKWGYIDTTGKLKLPALYESANNFHNGWAVVGKIGKTEFENSMVYINKMGKEMPGIKADYLNASDFSEGFAFYKKGYGEPVRYINKAGKEIFKSESDKYHDHGDFSNGLAAVPNKEGKYGYINTNGELAIPYQFSIPKTQYSTVNSIAFRKSGYATVSKDGKTITIDKTGK